MSGRTATWRQPVHSTSRSPKRNVPNINLCADAAHCERPGGLFDVGQRPCLRNAPIGDRDESR
eukprot:3611965-Prymnesium_polylepis.1